MTQITISQKQKIEDKVDAGERLSFDEGMILLRDPDIEWVGSLANKVRERMHGNVTSYIVNMHLNYSNYCTLSCMFCAFAKKRGDEDGYEMSMQEMIDRVSLLKDVEDGEVHIVGGLHPDYPYEYYPKMLATFRDLYPNLHLKAFTAVEIDYFAELAGKDVTWVLEDLKAHGLGSLPGGGAEVLTDRVHKKLYREKMGPDRWLEVHKIAHEVGVQTSATLLYGHIEKDEEIITHLDRLRRLQDETNGFLAYIPLRFHPDNTRLKKLRFATDEDVLRQIALGRLMLDNFPHIKAYWIMSGLENAKRSQFMGANDFDGTVVDERITHMAGCDTPVGVTQQGILDMIRQSGRDPKRRNALYQLV